MDDENYMQSSFVADFNEGYFLRNMFEYLKNTNSSGIFVFKEDTITYEQSEQSKTIVNEFEINTSDLVRYEFNSVAPIRIGLNLHDVLSITKTVGKKDGLRFYKLAKDPFLYIQIISQNNTNTIEKDNFSVIKPQNIKPLTFSPPEYSRTEKNPNVTLVNTRFIKLCKALSSLKCDTITAIGYPEGITLISMSQGILVGRIEKIGVVEDEPIENFEKLPNNPIVKMRYSTMKFLGRIGNLCSSGTIKIFMEKDKPMKLITKIGNYGVIRVYIYSFKELGEKN